MTEHMYLVVRSIFDRGEKKDYTLKKLDVIKLGRVKFRVKEISIASNLDEYKERKRKLERRQKQWVLLQKLQLKKQKQ
jgi:hypothetical protein